MTEPVKTRRLGRYQLDRLISRGGMGEIYLAHAEGAAGFKKPVCIKRILPHLAREQEFVDRFIDEAHIVLHLTHGNIVPVLDMDQDNGEYFIAMEYLPGRDLRDVIKRCDALGELLPLPVVVYVIGEICKGLSYAHSKRDDDGNPLHIIHRDVSPSNVLISREGVVKLTDFGIAKAVGKLGKSITGRLQGKFSYMSPEQAAGASVDHRSDIFSVASLAYELLTGVRPFEGDSDLATLEAVRRAVCEPPSSHRPELPPAVDAVIMEALSRDPAERPEDAADFGEALRAATADQGTAGERDMAAQLKLLFPGQEVGAPVRGLGLDEILAEEAERMLAGSPSGESRTLTASPPTRPTGPVLAPSAGDPSPTPSPSGVAHTPTPSVTGPVPAERRTLSLWLSGLAFALVAVLAVVLLWVRPGWLVETRLIISCEPDGALVFVDNANEGRCDVALDDIEPGRHQVRVEQSGFVGASREVEVVRGEETRVELVLEADPTLQVRIWVEPDGRFRVGPDGTFHRSGEVIPLLPGEYEVHALATGYEAVTRTVTFGPSRTEATIELVAAVDNADGTGVGTGQAVADGTGSEPVVATVRRVYLVLDGLPPGATVTYDGETRPYERRLGFRADEDRDIRIRVEAPGHEAQEITFNPARGPRTVTLRLPETASETRQVQFTATSPGIGVLYLGERRIGEIPGAYEIAVGCHEMRAVNEVANVTDGPRTVCVQASEGLQVVRFFAQP